MAGSRAKSVSAQREAGSQKIVFMGGSSIFGWGTDYENTCAYQLELMMEDQYPDEDFQFVNYAVPGYAMSQHLTLLKQIIARNGLPKLIVLDATSNCDVPSSLTDKDRERIRLRPQNRLRFYMGRFKFFQLLEMIIQDLCHDDATVSSNVLREPLPDYVHYLQEFIGLAEHVETKLIMIGMCARKDYVDQMISVAKENSIPYISFHDVVRHHTADLTKIPFSDCEMEMYQSVYKGDVAERDPSLYLLFPDKCHPNPTGHRVLALAVMQEINRKKLLN